MIMKSGDHFLTYPAKIEPSLERNINSIGTNNSKTDKTNLIAHCFMNFNLSRKFKKFEGFIKRIQV